MTKRLMKVSCKAALFNEDKTKVLLVEYNTNDFGLPGGHVEDDETPDQAMIRELQEELQLSGDLALTHVDFFMHPDGKLVLGYTGQIQQTNDLRIQEEEIRSAQWVDVKRIADKEISAGVYDRFILGLGA